MKAKPIALYIHMPWCDRKCPYCDFNSYALRHRKIDTDVYVDALIRELHERYALFQDRILSAIFIGGGTPSLIPVDAYKRLFKAIGDCFDLPSALEVTMEMNPESVEPTYLQALKDTPVTRISLGVQSFNDGMLKKLGRIHSAEKAHDAIKAILARGYQLNVDLMYALPAQTLDQAVADLNSACMYPINHLSWYQLTLEPQTAFYKRPPAHIPNEDAVIAMETAGHTIIHQHGFIRYEISAYAKAGFECMHNTNYWTFGDYIGIGAGAHGKYLDQGQTYRSFNINKPELYVNHPHGTWIMNEDDQTIFEYFLNRMRLYAPFTLAEFEAQTGRDRQVVMPILNQLVKQGLLEHQDPMWQLSALGKSFYNDVVAAFIQSDKQCAK